MADPKEQDIVYRLRKRAEIRRQIPGRKSVQAGEKDRLADLLDEAAVEIEELRKPSRVQAIHQCGCCASPCTCPKTAKCEMCWSCNLGGCDEGPGPRCPSKEPK